MCMWVNTIKVVKKGGKECVESMKRVSKSRSNIKVVQVIRKGG